MVRDPQLDVITIHEMRADQDLGSGRCEAQRVLQQVEQDLLGHRDVERHGRQVVVDVEPHAVGARDRSQAADGVLYEIGDVDRFRLDLQRARSDAAQLERVAHQPFEPFGLVGDRLEQLAPFLGLDPRPRREQRAGRRFHRGQRRSQVVADRRQETRALATDLGDEPRFAHLFLEPQPVDAGREPGDERFEQRPIDRAELVVGGRVELRVADDHRHVGWSPELPGRHHPVVDAERADLEPEHVTQCRDGRCQRVRAAVALEQAVRDVEPQPRFPFTSTRLLQGRRGAAR